MKRFQAPDDVEHGIDIGGEHFTLDDHGVVEVPEEGNYATLLLSAGFVPITPEAKAHVEHDSEN